MPSLEPLSLFSQLVSLSFSQSRESKELVKWIVSPRGNVFLIFYSRCFLPSPFFITVWFEPPPPRSCGRGTHIARSYSNAESAQRRARELQERKRNVRKFARLPFGMMNESLYSFCSQISFWLLKEKRCAKFNATNVTTKPSSSGLRFQRCCCLTFGIKYSSLLYDLNNARTEAVAEATQHETAFLAITSCMKIQICNRIFSRDICSHQYTFLKVWWPSLVFHGRYQIDNRRIIQYGCKLFSIKIERHHRGKSVH